MISVRSHAETQATGARYARARAAGRAQRATWQQEQAGLNRVRRSESHSVHGYHEVVS